MAALQHRLTFPSIWRVCTAKTSTQAP